MLFVYDGLHAHQQLLMQRRSLWQTHNTQSHTHSRHADKHIKVSGSDLDYVVMHFPLVRPRLSILLTVLARSSLGVRHQQAGSKYADNNGYVRNIETGINRQSTGLIKRGQIVLNITFIYPTDVFLFIEVTCK